jgi:hypothetical protein
VLRTWSQKKTTALSCLICFTRPGKTTTPAALSLRFSAPRYDNYCKIWVKIQKDKSLDKSGISGTFIKTVRDATAKKINRQKSPLAFFIS